MRLHNLPAKKQQRRDLRSRLTPEESYLWSHVQHRKLAGRKFRRQHSVGPYILDFYCPSEKLAIELDGASHDHEKAQIHDRDRDRFLRCFGIEVIRFENRAVRENLEGLLIEIAVRFQKA